MSAKNDCPSLEVLSAWFDREMVDDTMSVHIESCGSCQAHLDSFAQIDETLSRHFACDDKQADRITSNCIKAIQPPGTAAPTTGRLIPLRVWVRIAACLALAGLLIKTISDFQERAVQAAHHTANPPATSEVNEEPTVVERDIVKQLATMQQPAETVDEPVSPTAELAGKAPVRIEDLRLVSTGGTPTTGEEPLTATKDRKVGSFVRHVWAVENAGAPLGTLRQYLPGHDKEFEYWLSQKRDSYQLELTVSDRSLQGLVNHLDQAGYTLVSPAEPQPRLIKELEFTGKTVLYQVEFVEIDNQ